MGIVLMIHSLLRWLILIVALVVIVKHAIGLVQNHPYDRLSGVLMSVFSGMMDLQVLLGIIFITTGLFIYRIEHALVMILAAVVAHLSAAWKKKDDRVRYRNNLLAVIAAVILIVIGVSVLPGNRWTLSG